MSLKLFPNGRVADLAMSYKKDLAGGGGRYGRKIIKQATSVSRVYIVIQFISQQLHPAGILPRTPSTAVLKLD